MANIHDCLQRAVDGGELDQARADEAKTEFEQLVERYEQAMPRHQAEATAALHLKEATRKARRSRRHAVLNQLQSMVRLRHLVEDTAQPGRALLSLIEGRADDGFKGESVQTIYQALQARARNDIREFLEDAGINLIGNSRDRSLLLDVVRELHGKSTGNELARVHADAIGRVNEWQRQMFNAHGGDIGKLDDWGMRHSHDAGAIGEAGFEDWASFVWERQDWHRIIDRTTGKPFAAKGARPALADVQPMLRDIYDNITTAGWSNRQPAMAMGAKALYNQRAEPRVLHFRDADTWMEYNDQFGSSDLFTSLVGGIDSMSRDISQMRVLGPNPAMGLEYATQVATKIAKTSGDQKLAKQVDRSAKRARVLLMHATGAINNAEHEGWARFLSNVRHFNVATKLGSAILSSVTDLQTSSVGALAMGMNPANMVGTAVKSLFSSATVRDAARMGFVLDTLMDMHSSSARLVNDEVAGDLFSRMSGFVIRASGLSYWTDRMRLSVQLETAGHLASQADMPLRDVDEMLRQLLERNGITDQDWDHLRAADALFEARNGSTFLSPFWWLEHQDTLPRAEAEALAVRLQGAIQDQLETFIPTKRLRGSAAILGESRPGTVLGELGRSSAGFKNYAVSLTIGQIALFNSLPTPQSRATYLASMAMGSVLLGALAVQLKSLVRGDDPRPMTDAKFWGAAALQGGGLGIFGDFLFSETSRLGGGLATTIAGPVVGTIGDVGNVVMSNAARAAEGKSTFVGRDAANIVRRYTPAASTLWYSKLAWQRIVADQLQAFLDPQAEALWSRQMRKRARDYGTNSFWPSGDLRPERAPNLSNAVGAGS